MKSFAVSLLVALSLMFLVAPTAEAAGTSQTIPQYSTNLGGQSVFTTVTAGNRDTVLYYLEPNVSALTFCVVHSDTVDSVQIIMSRGSSNTIFESVEAGDTLVAAYTSSSQGGCAMYSVSLTQRPAVLRFIIYHAGVTAVGVTTPAIEYGVRKLYEYLQ